MWIRHLCCFYGIMNMNSSKDIMLTCFHIVCGFGSWFFLWLKMFRKIREREKWVARCASDDTESSELLLIPRNTHLFYGHHITNPPNDATWIESQNKQWPSSDTAEIVIESTSHDRNSDSLTHSEIFYRVPELVRYTSMFYQKTMVWF